MNNKLEKFVHLQGYCCTWAWLEANRREYTNPLYKRAVELGLTITKRALQQNRAAHRSGEIQCEGNPACLRERIKAGHVIRLHPHTPSGTSSER